MILDIGLGLSFQSFIFWSHSLSFFSFFRVVWWYPLSQKIHRVSDPIQSRVRIMFWSHSYFTNLSQLFWNKSINSSSFIALFNLWMNVVSQWFQKSFILKKFRNYKFLLHLQLFFETKIKLIMGLHTKGRSVMYLFHRFLILHSKSNECHGFWVSFQRLKCWDVLIFKLGCLQRFNFHQSTKVWDIARHPSEVTI